MADRTAARASSQSHGSSARRARALDTLDDFRGLHVTVMGLGVFGGGAGATRFLVSQRAKVTVTDLRPEHDLAASVRELRSLPIPRGGFPIESHLGGHAEPDFREADVVVVNPAVPSTSRYLQIARRCGVRLDTETNILFRLCPARIAGVTGTNGKSTTTALLGAMLRETGARVWVGGNIGGSLLPELAHIRPDDLVVLELSSFQLERLAWIERSPHLAIVLNLAPNHLDRHVTLRRYSAAKRNIMRFQGPDDWAVLNRGDAVVRRWSRGARGKTTGFGRGPAARGAILRRRELLLRLNGRDERVSLENLRLVGEHNLANAAAAAAGAYLLGARPAQIESAAAAFEPLPDRIEWVADRNGIRYYNDSIATTPEAVVAGLRSFSAPIVLLAGGYDKRVSLDALGAEIARRADAVVLMGRTAADIREAVRRHAAPGRGPRVFGAGSMPEAVHVARRVASPGSVVLLSPGCASYDMFANYRDRAEQFKECVRRC